MCFSGSLVLPDIPRFSEDSLSPSLKSPAGQGG